MFEDLRERHAWIDALKAAFPQAEVFVAGGAVRDALMGREAKDEDFVVRGVSAQDLEAFLKDRGRTDLVGRGFGVFKFEGVDIALPRTEAPHDTGGYRDVETQSDPALPIEKDLERRDFTMNAIAWDVFGAKLVDPHGGAQDIAARRIRAVGDAHRRFAEDLTRTLRALRFSVTLGFDIEHETEHAMEDVIPRLNERRADGSCLVPLEIVAREFLKSVEAEPARALATWHESGAMRVLIPELDAIHDEAQHLAERLPHGISVEATLAAIFMPYADGRVAEATLERLHATAATGFVIEPKRVRRVVDAAAFLASRKPDATPLVELEDVTRDIAPEALAVAWASGAETKTIAAWKAQVEKTHVAPLLTGAEVQEALGLAGPSPEVGTALRALREAQLEGKIRSIEEAKAWVRKPS